jgi:hypothetical protein
MGRKKGEMEEPPGDEEPKEPKTKRPNNFWAPFNHWWRENFNATGQRASVTQMRE